MSTRDESKTPFERLREAADSVFLAKAMPTLPPPTAVEPVDMWQIVVVGNIDPRQHIPHWYQQIACITDEEMAIAMKSLLAVFVPSQPGMPPQANIVQFDVGEFAILVTQDKWTIQTIAAKNRTRILDVAEVVFAKLNEAAIVAYGINKIWTIKLDEGTAKQFIGDRLSETDLPFPKGEASGVIAYTLNADNANTTYHISPSPHGEKWMLVMYNRQRNIPATSGKLTYFDLGHLIKEIAESDWNNALQFSAELAQCLTRSGRSKSGN